jgi:hypothetical protein
VPFALASAWPHRKDATVPAPVIDDLVEHSLRELADEAVQSRRWLANSGPEVSSLTECRCELWDDSGLGDALDEGEVVYSPEIDRGLRDLRDVLRRVDDRRPPTEVVVDPHLVPVRGLARQLLVDLRAFGNDKS